VHKLRCHSCGHVFHAAIGRGFRCAACHVHLRVRARDGDQIETRPAVENPSDAELMAACGHCGAPKDEGRDKCGYCGGDYPKNVQEARSHHTAAFEEFAKSNMKHYHPHGGAASQGGCLGALVTLVILS
jgi:hypothetical protein